MTDKSKEPLLADAPSRNEVWRMFDRIAHRYDLLNRLLSMGRDVVWRKKVSKHLPERSSLKVLDLATGTADLLLSMAHHNPAVVEGVGIDLAEKMLEIGRKKIHKAGLDEKLRLQTGDAVHIPFDDHQFDAVTISFGIRNVVDVSQSLGEIRRVLKPGGRVIILEFSLPTSAVMRRLYLFYFRHILPRVGGLISGDNYAYRYLNRTVETFPYGLAFCGLMRQAGFEQVKMTPLTFGIAAIYQGDTPGEN